MHFESASVIPRGEAERVVSIGTSSGIQHNAGAANVEMGRWQEDFDNPSFDHVFLLCIMRNPNVLGQRLLEGTFVSLLTMRQCVFASVCPPTSTITYLGGLVTRNKGPFIIHDTNHCLLSGAPTQGYNAPSGPPRRRSRERPGT